MQSEYSLWTRLPELGVIQVCREIGAAFVAFSPVGRAILTGKLTLESTFAASDFRHANPRFIAPNYAANLKALAPLFAFAKARGVTPGQVALAWTLAKGEHIIPIPGTRSAANLIENAGAGDLELSAADLADLERLLPVGFAHGDRYNDAQNIGPERYC